MPEVAMTERRPIDAQRDSAKFGVIGVDGDDSTISEMMPIGDTLYMVKGRGIYGVQLADRIDPKRTNSAIPDIQQRIVSIGSDDPLVARILLTAHTLFNRTILGPTFDRESGMQLALDLLKDLVALETMRVDMEAAEARARAAFEDREKATGLLALPSINNLDARCDAFTQKAGHVVKLLEDVAKLFYGDELKSKWIDNLTKIAAERYGDDSFLAQYTLSAGPFLLMVLDLRNMIEHPKKDRYIRTNDYRLTPAGLIDPPFVEIVKPGQEAQKATVTLLMKQINDDLLAVSELLMAGFCSVSAHPVGGMDVHVVELPLDQRSNKNQRFYYGTLYGDKIVRMG
jgi:hypothetical protein